jgi:hypothetical protein
MRTDRRTDRYDEANSRFSQFCERAKKELVMTETTTHDTYRKKRKKKLINLFA